MADIIAQTLRTVSAPSAWGFPLAFAAGALTSIGPCIAPRFAAAASLTSNRTGRSAALSLAAFVLGLAGACAAFEAVAGLLALSLRYAELVYGVVALALVTGGAAMVWRDPSPCRAQTDRARHPGGIGGAFLLGASCALVPSPCCTPIIAAILAYTSAAGSCAYGAGLLAVFALGHASPIGATVLAGRAGALLQRYALREAAAVVGGTLMLAFGTYYAVLA